MIENDKKQNHAHTWIFGTGIAPALATVFAILVNAGMTVNAVSHDGLAAYLKDDSTLLSGDHALHLYHGQLGAFSANETGITTCYDPAYYGGYVKSPVSASGCRPAEFSFQFTRAENAQAVYKICVLSVFMLLPVIACLCAKLGGSCGTTAILATLCSIVLCQSPLGTSYWRGGDISLLPAGHFLALFLCALNRYQSQCGISSWAVATFSLCAVMWLSPLVSLVGAFALGAVLLTSIRRNSWYWHFGLLAAPAIGMFANRAWILDLSEFWWMRTGEWSAGNASVSNIDFLPGLGAAPVSLIVLFLAGGLLGIIDRNWNHQASGFGQTLATITGLLVLGVLESKGEEFGLEIGGHTLAVALCLLIVPAARGLQAVGSWEPAFCSERNRRIVPHFLSIFTLALLLFAALSLNRHKLKEAKIDVGFPPPVTIGLEALARETNSDARILWEETEETDTYGPLLASRTGRVFVGGLGKDTIIEHTTMRLRDAQLAGRGIGTWTDRQLDAYFREYNIGWVVAQREATRKRMTQYAHAGAPVSLNSQMTLIPIKREPTLFLKGTGRIIECDSRRIVLGDLVPVNGAVVIAYHYHSRIRPSMDIVEIIKEPGRYSRVPMIRLKIPGPMTRLTLYWNGR